MEDKVIRILRKHSKKGLTITELEKVSKLTRSFIRTTLAKLEGAKKVYIRKVGMSKVYFPKGGKK
jgi:predicted transcriptional regulator